MEGGWGARQAQNPATLRGHQGGLLGRQTRGLPRKLGVAVVVAGARAGIDLSAPIKDLSGGAPGCLQSRQAAESRPSDA